MQNQISFLNMPTSEGLAKSIQKRMQRIHRHGQRGVMGAKVQLKVLNPQTRPGHALHECAIELEAGRQHVFIKKTKDNMYNAVAAAFKTLDRIVRERIRRKKRKH